MTAAAVAVVVAVVLALAGVLDEQGEPPPPGAVAQGGPDAVRAVERARAGLVSVTAGGRRGAAGTGFMVDDAGSIVTTAALLRGRREALVYAEGHAGPIPAKLVGTDAATTLALLRIPRADARSIEPLALADAKRVRLGEPVLAVGAPFVVDGLVTAGVVAGLDRSFRAAAGATVAGAIETDAETGPRNAGGPLLDPDGDAIGVNVAPASGHGAGYAVPADTAREVIDAIERSGSIAAASAGMRTETVDPSLAQMLGLPVEHGLLVRAVAAGGPAARAGIRPAPRGDPLAGDVIVAIAGQEVRRPGDVGRLLAAAPRRRAVRVDVVRDRSRLVLRLVPEPVR